MLGCADGWSRHILAGGKQPVILLPAALLASFAAIRVSTRLIRAQLLWWPGQVIPAGCSCRQRRVTARPGQGTGQ